MLSGVPQPEAPALHGIGGINAFAIGSGGIGVKFNVSRMNVVAARSLLAKVTSSSGGGADAAGTASIASTAGFASRRSAKYWRTITQTASGSSGSRSIAND